MTESITHQQSRTIDEYRAQLQAMLPELIEKFAVAELGLFGSRIRGDHRDDSDLDVLVSFRPEAYVSLFTLVDLELTISDRLGVKIDLAMKGSLKPKIETRILEEVQYL